MKSTDRDLNHKMNCFLRDFTWNWYFIGWFVSTCKIFHEKANRFFPWKRGKREKRWNHFFVKSLHVKNLVLLLSLSASCFHGIFGKKELLNALISRNFCDWICEMHSVEITEILSHAFLANISWKRPFSSNKVTK